MKIAILSVSMKGNDLAEFLKEELSNDSTIMAVNHFHKNIKSAISNVFEEYDVIIAIMASGIIIRSISPYIDSKISDPAVLNIDDNGRFVISMLSGHIGGANKFTHKIASIIGAIPVITTSTDVNNRLGIDTLAKDLYFSIDNYKKILPINKAILEGNEITFKLNKRSDFSFLYDYINNNTLEIDVFVDFCDEIPLDEINVVFKDDTLKLKKQRIVVGVGCKKGKSKDEIEKGLLKALDSLDLNLNRVDNFSSAEIKKNETGLLELSEFHGIPLDFIEVDKIKEFNFDNISSSEFVKSKFGIGGVCEPAALISAGKSSDLIYKKTAFNGVTIAIATNKS